MMPTPDRFSKILPLDQASTTQAPLGIFFLFSELLENRDQLFVSRVRITG